MLDPQFYKRSQQEGNQTTTTVTISSRRGSKAVTGNNRKSFDLNGTNKDLDIEVKITADIHAPVEVDIQTEI